MIQQRTPPFKHQRSSQPQANQKLSPLGDIILETKSQTAQHSLPMLHYLQSCSRAVKLDKEGLMLEESPEVEIHHPRVFGFLHADLLKGNCFAPLSTASLHSL